MQLYSDIKYLFNVGGTGNSEQILVIFVYISFNIYIYISMDLQFVFCFLSLAMFGGGQRIIDFATVSLYYMLSFYELRKLMLIYIVFFYLYAFLILPTLPP